MISIISDNIVKECWNLLSAFEDIEFTRNKIKEVNPKISKDKEIKVAEDISFYIKQSEELYNSSNTSILTNSLTLFYSMNNLVKALYIYLNPHSEVTPSHGLTLEKKENVETKKISDTVVTVNKSGTFRNLNEIIEDNINEKEKILIKDLFSLVPELKDIYSLIYHEDPNVYLMKKEKQNLYSYKIQLPNNTYKDFEKKDKSMVSENHCWIQLAKNASGEHAWFGITAACKNADDVIYKDIYNNTYLTLGIKLNESQTIPMKLHQANILYIILYTFSMYVRYEADKWNMIINSKEKAIIAKIIDVCKIKFLMEIVSLFNNEKYEFITKVQDIEAGIDYSELTNKILEEIKMKNMQYGTSLLEELL